LPVRFYFDHNVNRAVTQGLRLRGVDVLTALEDGTHRLSDSELLDRATALARVLFSTDKDFIIEARRRQREGAPFAGVVFAAQKRVAIGQCVQQLELLAKTAQHGNLANSLLFLPLQA
jgi:predicted nuclease of predicted toxin-antitoxin system